MDRTNLHMMMNFAEFNDTKKTEFAFHIDGLIWRVLLIVETLLFVRLIIGYFSVDPTHIFAHFIYQITDYIVYPITIALPSVAGDGIHGWMITTAIIGYALLAFALVGILNASRSPRSRIERARALSRKKYNH